MARHSTRSRGVPQAAAAVIGLSLLLAACSGGSDAGEAAVTTTAAVSGEAPQSAAVRDAAQLGGGQSADQTVDLPPVDVEQTRYEVQVIREGTVDIRIEPGKFETTAAALRQIATDLGGYVAQGETHQEEIDGETYQQGSFTLRVPENRFEDAIGRLDGLGERLDVNLSSQDVTEEFYDIDGRLDYWRSQQAFYEKLLDQATTIQDMVAIQSQMQQVLLNIESLQGRLRYLQDRTTFSTLTVGLTEVPGAAPVPPEPSEPGIIEQAIDQAGTVLLGTIAFVIVAAAFLLPLAAIGLVAFGVFKGVNAAARRPKTNQEA